MIKLTFSPMFSAALQGRTGELLRRQDSALVDALAKHKPGDAEVPGAPELYEQALTMVLVEVLANLTMALRNVFGEHADAHMDALFEEAKRRMVEARATMDGKAQQRKAASS